MEWNVYISVQQIGCGAGGTTRYYCIWYRHSTNYQNLKTDIPGVTQHWYAEDSGALGTVARIKAYFHLLERNGLRRGYYTKTYKSVLIVHPNNI